MKIFGSLTIAFLKRFATWRGRSVDMTPSLNRGQDIDALRKRFDHLHAEKIRAEANLSHSTRVLETLKKEAREKYGTDELSELRAKLATMTEENERKRTEYY